MAYDLRIYDVADGQMVTLQGVLREVALPLMPEHGMTPLGVWADQVSNRIYQLSGHDSLAAVAGNWDSFHADPHWLDGLRARCGDTSAVEAVTTVMLTTIAGLPPAEF